MNTLISLLGSFLVLEAVVSQSLDQFSATLSTGGGTASAASGAGDGAGTAGLTSGLQIPAGLLGQAGGLFGQSALFTPGGRFSGVHSFVSSGANSLRNALGSIQTGSSMGLDALSGGISSGASGATQSLLTGLDAGRQLLNTVVDLKAAALSSSMDIANQALDLADQISNTVPGLGPVVSVGTSIGRQTTGAIKNSGLSLLGQIQAQANQNLDMMNGAAQATSGALADTAQAGLSLAHNGVGIGVGTAGAGIDTGEGIAHGIIGALDSALDAGTSLVSTGTESAAGLATSVQADVVPATSQLTATISNVPDSFGEFN